MLESILQADFIVLEHGSGGSTLFMAERVKQITSVEIDPDWRRVVESKLDPARGLIVPSLSEIRMPWAGGERYDLILIDGEPVEDRCKWLNACKDWIKPGGWIVLDNANRPEYAAERDGLQEFAELVNRVDGNVTDRFVSTKYLVTEFWRVKDESREQPKQSSRRSRKH